MMSKTPLALLLTALISLTTAAADETKPTPLTMSAFVTTALSNNPAVQKIRATYDETRSLAARTAAIKDLILSAGTAWSWYNKLYSSGNQIVSDKSEWSTYAAISKKFPKLLGMDASLAFANSSVTSDSADTHTPSLTLTVTIPLLNNFLGQVDNNDLKKMKLALKMADRHEIEALEALLVTLQNAYIDWALATEKVTIYRGSMNRAAVLLNQTRRKQQLGIADAADLALTRQNYLLYRSRMLGAITESSTHYHSLLALMRGKTLDKKEDTGKELYKPALKWDKTDLPGADFKLEDLRIVQISRIALEDAKLALSSAKSSLKPNLDFILRGGTGSSKSTLGTAFSSLDQNNLYGGLEFSFPLQNTAQKEAKKAATAALKRQEAQYRELLISMGFSLRSLHTALKNGQTVLTVQQQVVATSLVRINAIYRKYLQGRVSLDQVTTARDAYATQQIAFIERSAALKKLALEYASQVDRLASQYPLEKKK